MKLQDLVIDNRSIGKKLLLVDIIPSYEYKDGVRTGNVSGYRYEICMMEKAMDKLFIRIDGKQQLEKPEGYAEVIFQNLELYLYWSNGGHQLGAKADGISLVQPKA